MNPPYGREISLWVKKAYESSLTDGTVVVCLLPARTDTRWWHDYVIAHAESVNFIRGRLCFSHKGPTPFPSALVVFGRPKIGEGETTNFGEMSFAAVFRRDERDRSTCGSHSKKSARRCFARRNII
jgi:hypothetical protein